ncbi:MAG: CehA/McbA family metallohydrolase [Candidatus Eisenbacteria sp.]|nr:CehA/McbA family metallohydrolase [Candidatus Eisenbacteria bacterium]
MRDFRQPFRNSVARAALLFLAAACVIPCAASAQGFCDVHCVLEDVVGEPVSARVSIRGSDDGSYRPLPDSVGIYHSCLGGYFYASGSFDVIVPTGTTRFYISKGFEYTPLLEVVNVASDTTLVFVLDRWIDLTQDGWYPGDTHAHLAHQVGEGGEEGYFLTQQDGYRMGSAEGLSVVHYLDNDRFFTGAPDPVSTPDCIVYFSEEYRSFIFGHLGLLGLEHLILPCTSGPVPSWPMNRSILDSIVVQSGAAVSYAHPLSAAWLLDPRMWPGGGVARELPINAWEGNVLAMDVLAYSNGRKVLYPWYKMLNSGMRVWGSAGTDAVTNRVLDPPVGGFRIYVNLGDSALTYDRWVRAFREGASFFSSGPLFRGFELGGAGIGDSLVFESQVPTWIDGEISFASYYPVESIELIRNGRVVRTFALAAETPQVVDTTFSVLIDETGWFAARARCKNVFPEFVIGDSLIAHTNPIFVRFGDDLLYAESDYWVGWLDTVEIYLDRHGEWDSPADSAHVYDRVYQARDYYRSVTNWPPSRPELMDPGDGDEVCTLTPRLSWHPSSDPDNTVYYRIWYGTDSTFTNRTVADSLTLTWFDVESPLADSTTYFWRVAAWDSVGHEVWSDDPECPGYPNQPCGWRFATAYDPDCQVQSVNREPLLGSPPYLTAYPNPFNPGTTIVFNLPSPSHVSVRIYDVEGRLRSVLLEETREAGLYRTLWTGRDDRGCSCGPGVYFCRIEAGGESATRKIILLQ